MISSSCLFFSAVYIIVLKVMTGSLLLPSSLIFLIMAYVMLSQLNNKSQKCSIEVKILRIWSSVNPRANNSIISYDLLVIDREYKPIQCVIKPADMPSYKTLLAENEVYIISIFFVTDKKKLYNVVLNPYCLNLVRTTKVAKSKTESSEFPQYYYDFVDFKELDNRIGNNAVLSDVIGYVVSIGNIVKMFLGENSQEVLRRNLEIRISESHVLRVTLWGDFAMQLEENLFNGENQTIAIIFTGMTVSKYMGQLTIATYSASKIIIDSHLAPVEEFKRRFHGDDSKVSFIGQEFGGKSLALEEKPDSMLNIHKLLALEPSESMNTKFTREARILELDMSQGWFYNSCSECNKTIIPRDGKFWCPDHNERVPNPRCKIPFIVEDETGIMQFMFFGDLENRLVKGTMMNLLALVNSNPMILPQPLKNLENQKRIFHIYMAKKNPGKFAPQFIIYSTYHLPAAGATDNKPKLQMPLALANEEGLLEKFVFDSLPTSPTQTKFLSDLFPDESPAKKQKNKGTIDNEEEKPKT